MVLIRPKVCGWKILLCEAVCLKCSTSCLSFYYNDCLVNECNRCYPWIIEQGNWSSGRQRLDLPKATQLIVDLEWGHLILSLNHPCLLLGAVSSGLNSEHLGFRERRAEVGWFPPRWLLGESVLIGGSLETVFSRVVISNRRHWDSSFKHPGTTLLEKNAPTPTVEFQKDNAGCLRWLSWLS